MIRDCKDWAFRNSIELRKCYNGFFITLTYAPEDPYFTGKLEINHVREFLKNLRNKVAYQYTLKEKVATIEQKRSNLRFFAVGEYGDKFGRAHYHLLLYNIPTFKDPRQKIFNEQFAIKQLLQDVWKHGLIHIGEINMKTINYVCKYIFKQDGFRIMSKNPAIGKAYVNEDNLIWHQADKRFYLVLEDGYKRALPEYYNRFFFDDADRTQHREINQEINKKPMESARVTINIGIRDLKIEQAKENRFNNLKKRKL